MSLCCISRLVFYLEGGYGCTHAELMRPFSFLRSFLDVQSGAFTLIGSAGDGHLGGEDFDDCLLSSLRSQAEELQGAPLLTGGKSDAEIHGKCSNAWLKQQAEIVKVCLSGRDELGSATDPQDVSVPPAAWWCLGSHGRNITGKVSVEEFESHCDALFHRSLGPVEEALARANVAPSEIDEVVLVGGSSRLPRVRRLLQKYLLRERLRSTVDPDLAVAVGAAMVND